MVQTKDGVGTNPWIEFVKGCAKEYKSSKEHASTHQDNKGTASINGKDQQSLTKITKIAKMKRLTSKQKDPNNLSTTGVKRSEEIAQKAEREQLTRKRLTSKQKDPDLPR